MQQCDWIEFIIHHSSFSPLASLRCLQIRGNDRVLETFWIFAVGLIPPLFSLWMMRRSEVETQARLRRALTSTYRVRTQRLYNTPMPSESRSLRLRESRFETPRDRYYLEGVGYLIGDISCRFNARSGYLRCAVNPEGPCDSCRHYQEVGEKSKSI